MKNVKMSIAISSLLFSFTALAASPKAGNWVSYGERYTVDGTFHESQWEKRIEQLNIEKKEALVRWHKDGFKDIDAWTPTGALLYIEDITKFCELLKNPGWSTRIENIRVPAGEFTTCRHEKDSGNQVTWYSDEVPFGLVKERSVFEDGDIHEHVLNAFGW